MVIKTLAKSYPQLLLGQFRESEKDSLTIEQTPAGPVEVLYLYCREDFENALRLLLCRGEAREIPASIGAMTINGIYNWQKGEKDVLVVLSDGPYSGVSAARAGQPEDTWPEVSKKIRLYHECTHVICRRLFPEQKEPVWDEIAADAVGIRKALGYYDQKLAAVFLGVSPEGYAGGRLENYVPEEERADILPALAAKVYALIGKIGEESERERGMDSYDFLMELQKKQEAWGEDLRSLLKSGGK